MRGKQDAFIIKKTSASRNAGARALFALHCATRCSASLRFALLRSASLHSASRRSALLRSASLRVRRLLRAASLRVRRLLFAAPLQQGASAGASRRSAPLRFTPLRFTLLRFAPLRVACSAPLRSDSLRFASILVDLFHSANDLFSFAPRRFAPLRRASRRERRSASRRERRSASLRSLTLATPIIKYSRPAMRLGSKFQ